MKTFFTEIWLAHMVISTDRKAKLKQNLFKFLLCFSTWRKKIKAKIVAKKKEEPSKNSLYTDNSVFHGFLSFPILRESFS